MNSAFSCGVEQQNLAARLRGHLRNALTHGTCAANTNSWK
jgi:hypothetical protein